MKKRKRKKKVKLAECSECHKQFDVDDLRILWKEFRLVCRDCFQKVSEIFQQ